MSTKNKIALAFMTSSTMISAAALGACDYALLKRSVEDHLMHMSANEQMVMKKAIQKAETDAFKKLSVLQIVFQQGGPKI